MIAQLDRHYFNNGFKKVYTRLLAYFLFEGRPLTTKGRFINPVVAIFLKICSATPFRKKIQTPVFIVGSGRSGTTLLGKLLSAHNDIAFLNEPKALWFSLNKKDDVIGTYSKKEGTFLLTENDAETKIIKRANSIYSCFLILSHSKRIADKYPELLFRLDYLLKIFPDAKILYITRNCSDTVLSNIEWNKKFRFKKNKEIHDWWGLNNKKWNLICSELVPQSTMLKNFENEISLFDDDKRKAAVEWILVAEKANETLASFPANVLKIKYESLLKNPETEIETILSFCKLPFNKKVFDYAGKIVRQQKTNEKVIFQEDFLNHAIALLSEN